MQLNDLLVGITVTERTVAENIEVSGLCYDTRKLQAGELFVARGGAETDGFLFIAEALQKGAVAVICTHKPAGDGPYLVVPDALRALAQLAANFYGHPARELTCLGVTGTNGKTTTTYLLKTVLERTLGAKVGLIGTNQNLIGETVVPTHRTTPEALELQALLREMVTEGCTHVVMEVSSHALVLHRTGEIQFAVAMFTNLTRDHLDFHGTMEGYREAKALLFRQADFAVLNLDDEAGAHYAQTVPCPCSTYAQKTDAADLVAKNVELFPNHVAFMAVEKGDIGRISLPIPGGFSVYNALCVTACCRALGISLAQIGVALATAHGVKGRVEVVPVPADFTVIIDYSHTPDALENILTAMRGITKGRVLCLFGCGGDRDKTKRPIMGGIALAKADLAIVTSDNPRTEKPMAIIEDILAGMHAEKARPYLVEPDRCKAIRLALSEAEAGDTVVLAGKGHETYQEINHVEHHLDEREEVAGYFAELNQSQR